MNIPKRLSSDQKGSINSLLIPLILIIILLLGTAGFAVWAFSSRQDYKDNVDSKIDTAVGVAVKETESQKDKEFIEKEKDPLKVYQGPSEYGSVKVKFPKTWSAYVDQSGSGGTPLSAYFNPGYVPGTNNKKTYSLRVEVVERSFADESKNFDSSIKQGKVTYKPFSLSKVPSQVGARIDGQISSNQQGILVLLPLRDKTIKVYTESNEFYGDFDNIILKNLEFTP